MSKLVATQLLETKIATNAPMYSINGTYATIRITLTRQVFDLYLEYKAEQIQSINIGRTIPNDPMTISYLQSNFTQSSEDSDVDNVFINLTQAQCLRQFLQVNGYTHRLLGSLGDKSNVYIHLID